MAQPKVKAAPKPKVKRVTAKPTKAELKPSAKILPFIKTAKQREADKLIASGPTHILLYGGSRSGKTFENMRVIILRAMFAPHSRHAVFRQKMVHLRASIWSDTFPKVMRLCFPGVKYKENKSELVVRFANGSEIWFGGLDDKNRTEKILGMEFATIYFNEITQISYSSILLGLTRLAQKVELPEFINKLPRKRKHLQLLALYDCNPPRKQHYSYQLFINKADPVTGQPLSNPDAYAHLQMNPADNADNLPSEYFEILKNLPPEQRKRFLEGMFSAGVEGALWSWKLLHRCRAPRLPGSKVRYDLPDMRRVIVAVDPPAGGQGPTAAECGIIVAGLGVDKKCYILADRSIKASVDIWAECVVKAHHDFDADGVVAEINNGGDMVVSVIRSKNRKIGVKSVRATRGKVKRAEPVAVLYGNEMVFHAAELGELENQMTEFTTDFDSELMGYSPDRVDALVWAVTELMLGKNKGGSTAILQGA